MMHRARRERSQAVYLDQAHPFYNQYEAWLMHRDHATGYDFGEAPCGSLAEAPGQVEEPVRWWSFDRPQRIASHLRRRDQRVEAIVSLGAARAGWTTRGEDRLSRSGDSRGRRGARSDLGHATREQDAGQTATRRPEQVAA